jgi:hypothetical protein
VYHLKERLQFALTQLTSALAAKEEAHPAVKDADRIPRERAVNRAVKKAAVSPSLMT